MLNEEEMPEGFFLKSHLSKKDIERLKEIGYKEYCAKSILTDKREEYLIRKAYDESSRRIILIKELVEFLKYNFKDIVFNAKIPRNSKIAEAPAIGKPVALIDVASPGSVSYLKLAEEIINKNNRT